jgi:hypothetical protein
MSHLPSIYSSARQYGLPFASAAEFFTLWGTVLDYWFPTPAWKVFGVLGGVGWVLLVAGRRYPFWAALAVLVLAINLAHFLLARKLPYERATGHFLPLALLGAAYLVELAVRAAGPPRQRVLLWAAFAGATLFLIVPSAQQSLEDRCLSACLQLAHRARPAPELPTYLPYGFGKDFLPGMYGPRDWRCLDVVPAGIDLQVCLFAEYRKPIGYNPVVACGKKKVQVWRTFAWESRNHGADAWPYDLIRIVGKTRPFSEQAAPPQRALVFWYLDPTRLGLSAQRQLEYVNGFDVKYIVRHTRHQAKLDIYSIPECFLFIAESEAEYRTVAEVVGEGLRRFGGNAVVFVPTRDPSHAGGAAGPGFIDSLFLLNAANKHASMVIDPEGM